MAGPNDHLINGDGGPGSDIRPVADHLNGGQAGDLECTCYL